MKKCGCQRSSEPAWAQRVSILSYWWKSAVWGCFILYFYVFIWSGAWGEHLGCLRALKRRTCGLIPSLRLFRSPTELRNSLFVYFPLYFARTSRAELLGSTHRSLLLHHLFPPVITHLCYLCVQVRKIQSLQWRMEQVLEFPGGGGAVDVVVVKQWTKWKDQNWGVYFESWMQRMRPSIVWHDFELSSFRTFSCNLKVSKDRKFPQWKIVEELSLQLHFQDILPKTCNLILNGLKSPSHCSIRDRTGIPCFFFFLLWGDVVTFVKAKIEF